MDESDLVLTPYEPKKSFWFVFAIGLGAILVGLTVTHVVSRVVRVPVDGYLVLGTEYGDHDAQIYVGGQLVGTGCAKVPWDKIFGWNGHEALGVVLPSSSPWPNDPNATGEATAERLAGNGSICLSLCPGSPGTVRYGDRHCLLRKEMLIRRPDGMLDQVFCLDAGFTDARGALYRVLVPIRVRTSDNDTGFISASSYATQIERDGEDVVSFGSEAVPRNGLINRYSAEWGFESATLPDRYLREIHEGGLWIPPSRSK